MTSTLPEFVPIPLGPTLGLKFRSFKRHRLWQQVTSLRRRKHLLSRGCAWAVHMHLSHAFAPGGHALVPCAGAQSADT